MSLRQWLSTRHQIDKAIQGLHLDITSLTAQRNRAEAEAHACTETIVRLQKINDDLTAMLNGRDADVRRLQRENFELVSGLLARAQKMTGARAESKATARDVYGMYSERVA